MNVYRQINETPVQVPTVATIGTFDGVHRGHRLILDALVEEAEQTNGRSLVVTFHPHPQEVLRNRGDSVPILTTLNERIALFDALGIDALLILEFTPEFAATPWQEFCRLLIEELGVRHLVVGHDHAFGRNREGNADSIREFGRDRGLEVAEVGPLVIDDETISSTKIRRALVAGDLATANAYLGRPYRVEGRVVKGDGRGKTLGIPTANIEPSESAKLLPADGVYAVNLILPDDSGEIRHLRGMANIGRRPTFTDGRDRTLEVNIFDFDEEIYHNLVFVEFRKFVRSEQKFASVEEFLEQLERDRRVCRDEESRDA
jgi:riboflavin kinase/FMN adenylyltransferase